ncbi:hypothetical protein LY78DRAFT_401795 [Colletotrichum sublineola]|nr:hypothetical protein LY78DRAFT_401795 [Colletotrichum sublineola]
MGRKEVMHDDDDDDDDDKNENEKRSRKPPPKPTPSPTYRQTAKPPGRPPHHTVHGVLPAFFWVVVCLRLGVCITPRSGSPL